MVSHLFSSIKDLGNYVIMHNVGGHPIKLNQSIEYNKVYLLHELTMHYFIGTFPETGFLKKILEIIINFLFYISVHLQVGIFH